MKQGAVMPKQPFSKRNIWATILLLLLSSTLVFAYMEPPVNLIAARATPATIAEEFISASKVAVFSKTTCPYCKKAKGLLNSYNATYSVLELNLRADGPLIQEYLANKTGQHTVPNIFIRGAHVGGCDALFQLDKEGKLKDLLGA
ncbi:glutaredoxin [Chytriomyces cf. hyalinus JEL632]|nr:glutaredoxin [Chytriomyces cf. hyalinus JEL632]